MNSEVTDYIGKAAPWQVAVCDDLRAMIHRVIPDVEEKMQYNKPHFLKGGQHAAVIHVAKNKVSFMVFNASEVAAVKGVLRSMGNGDRKTADVVEGQAVDYDLLAGALATASEAL
ncbi:DUF1801 domain-containing protein [Nocardia cyriacigeorgica]|uniref:DUF1801 domain-containing protein n=1 Tax=Nocardia cyriacigeorgica TaxID=135487 RepID=A0A6P1D7G0_9NOCA|nr:DUF1801 domain-containing protein [Nocardia cyriacigeorgica]NEW41453.1 DUF1801 domain-containing protein [Nocardia cyriacigeorgica]NEW46387.1 DUF1801 domain-containing protein [Nocardia cyriacigeorgica]NEW51965.1 DUF1801 domain-containing protein [Nocardia cyriacigeorgica]NEW55758.1 DUF1801 domain-containing protein [Nocardia cyriacigeorgica]